jgi:hypothetical protein
MEVGFSRNYVVYIQGCLVFEIEFACLLHVAGMFKRGSRLSLASPGPSDGGAEDCCPIVGPANTV